VILLGKIGQNENKLYNIADIFCIPSQYGKVVMEAVAYGVPVVGSTKAKYQKH